MSVSHPLLKKLKAFVIALRSKDEPVKDSHQLLLPLCETIEKIFLQGLKATNSWFGQPKTEYWAWISKIPTLPDHKRCHPFLAMSVSAVKKNKKTRHDVGRGRNFMRTALVKKVLTGVTDIMKNNFDFRNTWYYSGGSILGDEILLEIFSSLLLELQPIEFKLQLKNSSFLDITWELPVYKQYELVPSDDLGLDIRTVKGYPLITQVDANSVAGEDNKVMVGDVLDEMCGDCLRGVGKSGVYFIFNQHENQPIQLCVIKGHYSDGSVYGPIRRLLQTCDISDLSPATPTSPGSTPWGEMDHRPPPESLLPEEIEDEVPVHNSDGRATYQTTYLGKVLLGKDGRVGLIEYGVAEVLNMTDNKQNVILELGEKEVKVIDRDTNETLVHHLFTEISACGRRTDALKYYAFNAGETYCSLAQEFYSHVFEATTEEEAKVILCTIAQGFDRTHLMT
ncbi:uncharacterized protein LOC128225215 [Mya arenaria]|uniref:uncharacterized protein LOC128225215 n=1 Tax=Mya arenaria TaxID=6604 RepID=UPI0022E0EB35|nr:uncharacterized protein LOC128225215 [Mya arenaria]